MMNFESSVYVSEQLNRQMVNAAQELAVRAVTACSRHYDFDCDEALRMLGIVNAKVIHSKRIEVKSKVTVLKAAFPLPYNGELKNECCYALRQNNGLYTQCQSSVKGDTKFCKQCKIMADKGVDGVPEYGTIEQRMEVGIFEYVDPKGRKPVAYSKVMKKYKITKEQAEEEAVKFNININEGHFEVQESDSKRGRPSSGNKAPKEAKGTKGRPKKAKKVIQIEGDNDDLFAALVADANEAAVEKPDVIASTNISKNKNQGEKEAKRLKEKEEKEAKLAAEKAEKEAKLAAEKAEKEAKLAAEKAEKEAKLAVEKAEKEALAKQKKEEKEEKLALAKQKKEALEQKKESKLAAEKSKKPEAKVDSDDDKEEEVVKKITFEGNKYLKSKKTGIVYDYNEYVKNGEQIVIGKWNETDNKIVFSNSGEESEEEYDEA
jgi:hypothetical protein